MTTEQQTKRAVRTRSTTGERLAASGLALELIAVGAVLVDGHRLSSVAWIPGWIGLGLAVAAFRAGRRLAPAATAVLFLLGSVLGIAAALR